MESQKPKRPLATHPKKASTQPAAPAPRPRLRLTKREITVGSLIIGVFGVIIISLVIIAVTYTVGSKAPAENPDYATVIPMGSTIEELGGWTRISPPESDPVFAYLDDIDGVTIQVSEQQLSADSQSVEDIAKGFGSTTKLSIDNEAAWLGTSAAGPQFLLLEKNNLIILIRSESTIENDAWTDYVASLSVVLLPANY